MKEPGETQFGIKNVDAGKPVIDLGSLEQTNIFSKQDVKIEKTKAEIDDEVKKLKAELEEKYDHDELGSADQNEKEYRPNLSEEEKRANQEERMNTKLYVARNVEGKPNKMELETVRDAEKILSKYPAFVGISPFGSVFAGYSKEGSDIDIEILCDSSKLSDESQSQFNRKEYEDFLKKVDDDMQNLAKEKEIEIQCQFSDLRLDRIINHLNDKLIFEDDIYKAGRAEVAMSRLVSGQEVNKYRELVSEELKKHSKSDQEGFAGDIIDKLTKQDEKSLSRRRKSMPESDNSDILYARDPMWEKRVRKIWGINK